MFLTKAAVLLPALLLGGFAGGCFIAVCLASISGGLTISGVWSYLGLLVFFSVVLSGVAIVIGLPAYFLISRFIQINPAITTAIGAAVGVAAGTAWGHGMPFIFSFSGFIAGLVTGLQIERSNRALKPKVQAPLGLRLS